MKQVFKLYHYMYYILWRSPQKDIWNLTLNLLTSTIVAPPSNASKWQMGFNSAFKGLNQFCCILQTKSYAYSIISHDMLIESDH
jgi:hypothetical protein